VTASGDAIRIDGLTRRFEELVAVDHVSLAVKKGEIFGLLGPNGAGKTTIINMLTTLLRPSEGGASVAGHDVTTERDEVRRAIGVVFQEPALDANLTGRENLDFHAMMYGMDRDDRQQRIAAVLDLTEMTEKADVLVDHYSGGMKRRLEIGRGLVHRPQVLFLDEPTLGLDAQTRRRIWEYIRDMIRDGSITIVLTTHYMEEADYLCDRIAIIDHGRIVALDTPANLKNLLGGDVITLEAGGDADRLLERVQDLSWIKGAVLRGSELTLTVEMGEQRVPELVMLAQAAGITIQSVRLRKPSLEDVFLHFTGRTMREKEVSHAEQLREKVTRRARR
jgi:ABC-2 type transport system ATP-binding protein